MVKEMASFLFCCVSLLFLKFGTGIQKFGCQNNEQGKFCKLEEFLHNFCVSRLDGRPVEEVLTSVSVTDPAIKTGFVWLN